MSESSLTVIIKCMCSALQRLESISTEKQPPEYSKICNDIREYIKTNCQHKIVSDLVDVHWDQSMAIKYCIHCETTF